MIAILYIYSESNTDVFLRLSLISFACDVFFVFIVLHVYLPSCLLLLLSLLSYSGPARNEIPV